MVLRFSTEVLEDGLLPVTLHIIPVLDLSMADGVIHAISRSLRVREGLVADEEVEVLDTALGCKVSWTRGNCGT